MHFEKLAICSDRSQAIWEVPRHIKGSMDCTCMNIGHSTFYNRIAPREGTFALKKRGVQFRSTQLTAPPECLLFIYYFFYTENN